MTRKADTGHTTSSSRHTPSLRNLRTQIDKLDLHILELLNKRATVASQIGKVKADQGGEVFSAAREEEVLGNVLAANGGPLEPVTIKAIFRELISGSRSIQKQQKIAFLGPE
jgi:chorismate mutase/prephenate dehydratase